MSRKVMRGWRYFKCDDCGTHWRESCRDHATPSGSVCPNYMCDGRLFGGVGPYDSKEDASLETDGHGNLAGSCLQFIKSPPDQQGGENG